MVKLIPVARKGAVEDNLVEDTIHITMCTMDPCGSIKAESSSNMEILG